MEQQQQQPEQQPAAPAAEQQQQSGVHLLPRGVKASAEQVAEVRAQLEKLGDQSPKLFCL